MRVYIAGPYQAETYGAVERNVQAAIEAAFRIHHDCDTVYCFIPHLYFWANGDSAMAEHRPDKKYEASKNHEAYWLAHGLAYLETCGALVYIALSPGTHKEIAHARHRGIEVYKGVEAFLKMMENLPNLADLKGIAPDITGGLPPEEHVRRIREQDCPEEKEKPEKPPEPPNREVKEGHPPGNTK